MNVCLGLAIENINSDKLPNTVQVKGRFAPSPTGRMHAGNIYSYLCTWLITKKLEGKIVLRIEDLDVERSKSEFIDLIQSDFNMLGLTWDEGPYFQACDSAQERYKNIFDCFQNNTYPCFCTRAELKNQSAPHFGEKRVYSGKCRNLSQEQIAKLKKQKNASYRLKVPNRTIEFCDGIQGVYSQNLASECGDFVIKRADGLFAYQLAVVADDAAQGISVVVRGYDLINSTPQQIYLHELLDAKTPDYWHVPLFVNDEGRRLSKRDKDASLDELLSKYKTPEGLLGHIAYIGKITDRDVACSAKDLLEEFNLDSFSERIKREVGVLQPIVFS